MRTITELTISRHQWLRGEGGSQSYLLRGSDGKMCCLGFFCIACGIDRHYIENHKSPGSLADEITPPQLKNDVVVQQLMIHNDLMVDLEAKEEVIRTKMLELNPPVKVIFID